MTKNQFDLVDMLLSAGFLLFGIFHLGAINLADGSVLSLLTTELWSFSNAGWTTSITVAFAGSLLSFGGIAVTNDWQASAHGAVQFVLVLVTFWLILSPPFIPLMELFLSVKGAAFVSLGVQFVTALSISYFG